VELVELLNMLFYDKKNFEKIFKFLGVRGISEID
jgi:hypothetical protein